MVVDVRGPGGHHLPAADTRIARSDVGYPSLKRDRSRRHFAESGIDQLHTRARIDCQSTETGSSGLRVLRTHAEAIQDVAAQSSLIDVRWRTLEGPFSL